VAASRGKELNMFYDYPTDDGNQKRGHRNLLSNLYYGKKEEEIPVPSRFDTEPLAASFVRPYSHERAFSASTMYDFLYMEDVAACSDLIKVTPIPRQLETIDVKMNDENIDLSACVGTLVEANYFEGYDLKRDRVLTLMSSTQNYTKPRIVYEKDSTGKEEKREITFFDSSATNEDKVLILAALSTQQDRYCHQVASPLITAEDAERICERLRTEFTRGEIVQTALEIDFKESRDPENYHPIHAICDVVKGDTITELKFTSGLKETHKLQLAFQLCAFPGNMKGRLWNVKTNEMVEVEVPDKIAFLRQTVRAISKRNWTATEFAIYMPDDTRLTNVLKNKGGSVPQSHQFG
jgi:hypothetical protein